MSETALRRTLAAAAIMWAGALILGAFIASRPEVGSVAYLVSVAIYKAGALVCHQRPERSFHVWGAQLPVCARCAGIYAGALMAAVAAATISVGRDRDPVINRPMLAVLLAAFPTALTLLHEWTTGLTPGNWTRAAAGFPLGAIVTWVIVLASTPRAAVAIH